MEQRTYSLYLDADLNRVFTESLPRVAAAELRLVVDAIGSASVGPIEPVIDGRTRLLRFATAMTIEDLVPVIGQLSSAAALFSHHRPDGEDLADGTLRPVSISESLTYGSELVTTQRYRGKTNERLTRAMLNIAMAASGTNPARPVGTVLDPMCGRGTTLNWALAYGMSAIGIDTDRSSLDHHATFLQTWAKRQRLPHKLQRFRPGNRERRSAAFHVAADRATFKSGGGQTCDTFNADGADRSLPLKRTAADMVVTDLPYGVQHRRSTDGPSPHRPGGGGPETLELLARVLPVWHRWLRPGGAVCLAWNTKRGPRRDVARALVEAGFEPITAAGGYSMAHTVGATVDRDVMVAVRGAASANGR